MWGVCIPSEYGGDAVRAYRSDDKEGKAKGQAALAALASVLKVAVDVMYDHEQSDAFQHPVDTERFEDYLDYIATPIALSDIRARVGRLDYTSAAAFRCVLVAFCARRHVDSRAYACCVAGLCRADLKLLVDNCRTYCEETFPLMPVVRFAWFSLAACTVEHAGVTDTTSCRTYRTGCQGCHRCRLAGVGDDAWRR